jgi:hypothetical protein
MKTVYRATLAQQGVDRYPKISFDVPAGTQSLEVRLDVAG